MYSDKLTWCTLLISWIRWGILQVIETFIFFGWRLDSLCFVLAQINLYVALPVSGGDTDKALESWTEQLHSLERSSVVFSCVEFFTQFRITSSFIAFSRSISRLSMLGDEPNKSYYIENYWKQRTKGQSRWIKKQPPFFNNRSHWSINNLAPTKCSTASNAEEGAL